MSLPPPPPRGLLLVGHGTRDLAGQAEFHELARLVAEQRQDWQVAPCFLELAEPTIDAAVQRLAAAGVRTLVVAPLLLLAAGHSKRDVPHGVAAALDKIGPAVIEPHNSNVDPAGGATGSASAEAGTSVGPDAHWHSQWHTIDNSHPGLSKPVVRECPPLGLHPLVLQLSAARLAGAIGIVGAPLPETELVMVFRGSSDEEAQGQARELAARCAAASGISRRQAAFVAAARPSLAEAFAAAAAGPARRIVVQPHLLFAGDVLREVDESVASAREQWPQKEWLLVPRLGPDPLIAATIWDLADVAVDKERAGGA